MKEAMGGISIFQIVITLILLFIGIMCLTINHSKAFGVKDEVISLLESSATFKNGEVDQNTIDKIVDYLDESGHRITGKCPNNTDNKNYIGYTRNKNKSNDGAVICINAVQVDFSDKDMSQKCPENRCSVATSDMPKMVYYEIVLFYQLDIPIINNIFNFKMYGSTKIISGEA